MHWVWAMLFLIQLSARTAFAGCSHGCCAHPSSIGKPRALAAQLLVPHVGHADSTYCSMHLKGIQVLASLDYCHGAEIADPVQ